MKKLFPSACLAVAIFALASCATQKNISQSAQVIRDCTGTYLRIDSKDYQVCNTEMMSNYAEGTMVNASFRKIDDCPSKPEITCMMFHENEGWIEISTISK